LNARARRFTRLTLGLAWLLTASGCTTLGYYHQAITGHLGLMLQRQPIDRLIESKQTDPELVAQLHKVEGLREFSREQLGLPSDGQYTSYVDIERRYVVWNVFAAPPLSLNARQWCYPVVGCASYRGYYSEQQARRYAATLAERGMDVYVGGTTAYSTLGWFNDPVLNTFVYRRDDQLADLVFHELAHHLLYIAGDTVFNESFASLVAGEGVKRWLAEQDDPAGYSGYLAAQERKQQFIELVATYRQRLDALYTSTLPEADMLDEKRLIIDELKAAHRQLKSGWGDISAYDHWFRQEINNAQLNTVATYYELVPALAALLASHEDNLAAFYTACLELKELDTSERHARLNALLTSVTPVDIAGHSDRPPTGRPARQTTVNNP
jgi:predicted aminopeptidase